MCGLRGDTGCAHHISERKRGGRSDAEQSVVRRSVGRDNLLAGRDCRGITFAEWCESPSCHQFVDKRVSADAGAVDDYIRIERALMGKSEPPSGGASALQRFQWAGNHCQLTPVFHVPSSFDSLRAGAKSGQ